MDAHHRFCEFHAPDHEQRQPDSLIDFSSAKTNETRLIGALVCKGIERRIFDQSAIRNMRQHFFDLKAKHRFIVAIEPAAIDWLAQLRRHPSYNRWVFHPVQARLPGFDWKEAARRQFTEQFASLFELMSGRYFGEVRTRARDLVTRFAGQEVFDPGALKPSYELTLRFAEFVARNSGLDFRRSKPEQYRWKGAPPAMLAVCALVLFVSDWDINTAIEKFSQILAGSEPLDPLLGNVLGLNPFHDHAAWHEVVLAQQIAQQPSGVRVYEVELRRIEAELRETYRAWLAAPR